MLTLPLLLISCLMEGFTCVVIPPIGGDGCLLWLLSVMLLSDINYLFIIHLKSLGVLGFWGDRKSVV